VLSRLRSERGFNLIELMVSLLILGVLLTVAMPIFLGAVERADDKASRRIQPLLHALPVQLLVGPQEQPAQPDDGQRRDRQRDGCRRHEPSRHPPLPDPHAWLS